MLSHRLFHDPETVTDKQSSGYHKIKVVEKAKTKAPYFQKPCTEVEFCFDKNVQHKDPLLSGIIEAFVGELFRCFSDPSQPKTRLAYDVKQDGTPELSIMSKKVANLENLAAYVEKDGVKFYPGLAASLFLSYATQEEDAKKENFYYANGKIGRLDFEWSFFPTRLSYAYHVRTNNTLRDMINFPDIQDHKPYIWPDEYRCFKDNKEFRDEYFITLMRVLVTPYAMVKQILDKTTERLPADKAKEYKDRIFSQYTESIDQFKQNIEYFNEFKKFAARIYVESLSTITDPIYSYFEKEKLDHPDMKAYIKKLCSRLADRRCSAPELPPISTPPIQSRHGIRSRFHSI